MYVSGSSSLCVQLISFHLLALPPSVRPWSKQPINFVTELAMCTTTTNVRERLWASNHLVVAGQAEQTIRLVALRSFTDSWACAALKRTLLDWKSSVIRQTWFKVESEGGNHCSIYCIPVKIKVGCFGECWDDHRVRNNTALTNRVYRLCKHVAEMEDWTRQCHCWYHSPCTRGPCKTEYSGLFGFVRYSGLITFSWLFSLLFR